MYEIAYARLRDAEQRGRGCLCQTSIFDDLSKTNHEVSANSQVLRLLLRETQVLEHIARRPASRVCREGTEILERGSRQDERFVLHCRFVYTYL